MNARAFKTIVILLSVCLLSILVLQGFWIRNFYIQKVDEFNRTVYQCLANLGDRLHERENIHIIKESLDMDSLKITQDKFDTLIEGYIRKAQFSGTPATRIKIFKSHHKDSMTIEKNGKILISDTIVKVDDNNTAVFIEQNFRTNTKRDELNKLVKKMMVEIKTLDASPTDEIDALTLSRLLKDELENKGLFSPFEFSLRKKTPKKEKTLAQSQQFKENKPFFKSNLDTRKVFDHPHYILIQFPSQKAFVFAGMRNVLILSALFSLLVIGIFYYTVRTILKQKKIGEMKNDFINNMTHELKTPIATISLAIDALNNPLVKNDEAKLESYKQILKEENQKLNRQVERVLEIAQLDKGEISLNKKPLNLNAVIEWVVSTFSLQIKDKRANVKITPSTQAVIHGDERHITTVFSNLLDNALKYSSGNCEIEIKIENKVGDVEICFKDNGIGIDRHLQEKIFEKFYRAQGGNLHDVKGFGLGLSYVKSIVEAHGGKIRLHSELNKGSEFILTFKAYAA